MNNQVVDYLYDFAVNLTYESHENGSIDPKNYVDNFLELQEIDQNLQKTFQDYANYYLSQNHGWFPDRDEIEDWYYDYKKVRV